MKDRKGRRSFSRRGFVLGAAAAGAGMALAGCSGAEDSGGFGSIGTQEAGIAGKGVPSRCVGCSAACAFRTQIIADGDGVRVGKLWASAAHPESRGSLCAYGYASAAALEEGAADSSARVIAPLRRKDDGSFEEISWEEAYALIGEALGEGRKAPLAVLADGSDSNGRYLYALADTLGSKHAYSYAADGADDARCGEFQAIGTSHAVADVEQAAFVVVVGASSGRMTPGHAARLAKARENGAYVALVDAMVPYGMPAFDEWIAVAPGTESALLLAACAALVRQGRVSASAQDQAEGLDTWADSLDSYTPVWAARETGVAESQVESFTARLVEAAPACAIDASCPGALRFGNAAETSRVVCALNALMGSYNVAGGTFVVPESDWDASMRAYAVDGAPGIDAVRAVGGSPLALVQSGSMFDLMDDIESGEVGALVTSAPEMLAWACDAQRAQSALAGLDVSVAVCAHLGTYARMCDVVLPRCSAFEEAGLPRIAYAQYPAVCHSEAAIEPSGDAQTLREICRNIASAAGADAAFFDAVDAQADAFMEGLGLSGAFSDDGAAQVVSLGVSAGDAPAFGTASGKVVLASDACEQAGAFGPCGFTGASGAAIENGVFRLLVSALPTMSCAGAATEAMREFIGKEKLDRMLINAQSAKALGIVDDDEVTVSSSQGSQTWRARLVGHIHPGAVFLPLAVDDANSPLALVQPSPTAGFGTPDLSQASVTVRKAGA